MPRPRGFWTGVAFGALSALSAIGLLAASSFLIAAAALQIPILYLQMPIVGVRAFALGRAFFRYLERISSHEAAFRMLGRLRTAVFASLIPGAPVNLQRRSGGDTVSRLVSDVDELQNLPLRVWQPIVVSGIACGLSVLGVAFVSVPAALILLGSLVLAAWGAAWLPARLARRAAAELAPARGRQFDLTMQYLSTMDVLIAFDAVEHEQRRLEEADRELYRHSRRVVWGDGLSSALQILAIGLSVVAGFLVTADLVVSGELWGPLMALVVLLPMSVFEVFETTPKALLALQKVRASARRIEELAPDVPEVAESLDREGSFSEGDDDESAAHCDSLRAENISCGWPGEPPVVSGLSFELRPGRRILVTGPSGSGKSTVAWTLERFLELQGGRILINGDDAALLSDQQLRRVVGLCEQRPHVFASTIRANLHLADPTATDDTLIAMVQRVGLGALLRERDGLDTLVGENGALLSGGQVQRLALARALLGRFHVIVLDEPTANVDPELRAELMVDLLSAVQGEDAPAVLLMSHDVVPADLIDEHIRLGER